MPDSDTLASVGVEGPLSSLKAICSFALLAPCCCGAKLTPIVQVVLGAIEPRHPFEVIR